jgi:hypothetical protein
MFTRIDFIWAIILIGLGLIEVYWNRNAFDGKADTCKSLYKVRFVFGVILSLGSILVLLANLVLLF